LPKPTPDSLPFWKGLKAHELRLQRCRSCRQAFFYPRNVCPHCLSGDVEWFHASGRGRVHTFVVNHLPGRNFPLDAPYVIAVVELEEGPRLLTNLVGVEPDPAKIRCEMPVVIEYVDVTEEFTLPRFRPAS
jgi:uncharacterized OB-fold protein